MDSQVTLINPGAPTELVFDRVSLLNAKIYVNSRPYFVITTTDPAASHTEIREIHTGRVLVTIRRRNILPDTITFADRFEGKTLKINDWLKKHTLPDGHQGSLLNTPYGAYIWRTDPERRLVLSPDDDLEQSVAYILCGISQTSPVSLLLQTGTEGFREEIVASFMILEHRLRMDEKAYKKTERKHAHLI